MSRPSSRSQRRGAALAVAAVFLLLAFLLAVSGRSGGLFLVVGAATPLFLLFLWERQDRKAISRTDRDGYSGDG